MNHDVSNAKGAPMSRAAKAAAKKPTVVWASAGIPEALTAWAVRAPTAAKVAPPKSTRVTKPTRAPSTRSVSHARMAVPSRALGFWATYVIASSAACS